MRILVAISIVASAFPILGLAQGPSCEQIFPAAASALHNSKQGTPREDLAAVIPSREQIEEMPDSTLKHFAIRMHEVLDEVYAYEDLDQMAYSAYSAEVCLRRTQGKSVPPDLDSIYQELLLCNDLPESERIPCGMRASGSSPDEDS